MKNKSMTYGLIAIVLIIWGLVFYRVFAGLGTEEESFVPATKRIATVTSSEEEPLLVLFANYRDPFLGNTSRAVMSNDFSYSSGTASASSRVIKKKETKIEETPIDWSFLDYVGIVQNKDTKKKVGLLVISGQEYMVNEKDVINGVAILSKERDSIQVQYNKIKKWIRR